MADFDTWLQATRLQISNVNTELNKLQTALDAELTNLEHIRQHSAGFQVNMKILGGVTGSYFQINESLRNALSQLAYIGHDGETLISLDYLLAYSGIDLGRVLRENINSDQIQVSQNSAAQLLVSSTGCARVNQGYLGLVIPVKIKVFNQDRPLDLSVTIYLGHRDPNNATLYFSVANTLNYCPENAFNLEQGTRFLNLARPKVEAGLQNFGYNLGNVSIGNRRTILYGATITKDYIRLYTSFGLRQRRRMPLLNGLQAGYQILIKLGNEFLLDTIRNETNRNGLTIRSGPNYNSPTTFMLEVAITKKGSVKIGCVNIHYTIVAAGKVNVRLGVAGTNRIVMTVEQFSEPEIIESPLDWFPGLGTIIEAVLNLLIRKFSVTLNFQQEFTIDQNQRAMAVELTPQFLLLKLKM